jgi:hypothetical protein
MNLSKKDLKDKISDCGIFIVLSTSNYLDSLRKSDKDIMDQIDIARELKKPFLIIEDGRMSQQDKEETRRYFSKDNVIDKITVNLGDKKSWELVAKKIRDVTSMFRPESGPIEVIFGNQEDEDRRKSNG